MDPLRRDRIKALFDGARQLPPGRRDEYLRDACRSDPEASAIRAEVESLLRAHEQAGDFLASPTIDNPPTPAELMTTRPTSSHETRERRIGPYRILQQIGEGGFGSVYLAEQEQPVRRRVALKLIKPGMDTRQFVARFEAERQALALMDHPHIARVFDGGATEDGRPYFVMELVKGLPITRYCDEHRLPVRRRLELFAAVCQGVQHAHTKGIIHRDLKPSNVLVTEIDGQATVKVIDFGIAKATVQPLTDKTVFTELQQMIGTPAYMSPEQAGGSPDIDTRTDVYSLGVLLYELLTGTTPFEPARLKQAAFDEILRIIREEDPPRPSTRLSSLVGEPRTSVRADQPTGESARTEVRGSFVEVAARRSTDPAGLSRDVRGELDWIVMKCLDKDRGRRYETANGLAADVARFLAHEPIVAAPPSASYRMRKFVRRNKGYVLASGLVVAALAIGLGAALWQARVAAQERDAARLQAARSDQVKSVLTDILAAAGPGVARGRDATLLRELMEKAAAQIGEKLADFPQVEAEVRVILGATLRDIGDMDAGTGELTRAIDLYHSLGPGFDDKWADATEKLGHLLSLRADNVSALERFREAHAVYVRLFGESSLQVAVNLDYQGQTVAELGDPIEGEKLLLRSLELKRLLDAPGGWEIAVTLDNLGELYNSRGEFSKALPYLEEAANLLRALGEGHEVGLAATLSNTGLALGALNRLDEAQAAMTEATALHRKVLGERALDVAIDLAKLATVHENKGEFETAEKNYLAARDIIREREGDDHVYVAIITNNIGLMYSKMGEFATAETWLREAVDRDLKIIGADHPETAQATTNLARAIFKQGRFSEALPWMRQALATFASKEGASSRRASNGRLNLSEALRKTSEEPGVAEADALAYLQEATTVLKEGFELSAGSAVAGEPAQIQFRQRAASELATCFEALNSKEPGKGHDDQAAHWRAVAAEAPDPASPSSGQPGASSGNP